MCVYRYDRLFAHAGSAGGRRFGIWGLKGDLGSGVRVGFGGLRGWVGLGDVGDGGGGCVEWEMGREWEWEGE